MSFKITCPHCTKTLNVTEPAFGKTVPCPGCNQPIDVPQPSALAAAARFTITCPHCQKNLNINEAAFGKTVSCPACNQPIQVPHAAAMATSGGSSDPSPPWSASAQESASAVGSPSRLPDGMPPMPQIGNESGTPQIAADLLARYRSTSKPKRVGFKEKLTRAMAAAKKRGLALKLGHEVKNLQMAIDTQLETLGTLTLTHRPSGVGISDEIAELSQIQDGLSQKQGVLDSLRQTKGSGPVVKELSKEVAQLYIRQKAVMVAIGKKALELRPDMPGAAGCYAALDRLQSSLEAKQRELRAIEGEVGPLTNTQGTVFLTLKRPLIAVGAIAGGLVVLYLLWELLAATVFAAGLPTWVRYYVPNDTQAIVYFNVDMFRKTQVFKKLEGLLPSRAEMKRSPGLQLRPDEVRDVFFLVQEDGSPIVVLRTYEDLPLAKIVSNREHDSQPQKYKGFQYIRSDNGYCAKTATCTYCIAPSEDSIERTLKRLDRKESPRLGKDLQSAVESVASNDYYVAAGSSAFSELNGMRRRLRRVAERVNYAAAYVSFSSSVRLQYLLAFDKQSDAEDCKEAIESASENLNELEDALERLPAQARKVVAKVAKRCREATTITRKGCLIHSRTDLNMADVEEVIDQMSASYRGTINDAPRMGPLPSARPAGDEPYRFPKKAP